MPISHFLETLDWVFTILNIKLIYLVFGFVLCKCKFVLFSSRLLQLYLPMFQDFHWVVFLFSFNLQIYNSIISFFFSIHIFLDRWTNLSHTITISFRFFLFYYFLPLFHIEDSSHWWTLIFVHVHKWGPDWRLSVRMQACLQWASLWMVRDCFIGDIHMPICGLYFPWEYSFFSRRKYSDILQELVSTLSCKTLKLYPCSVWDLCLTSALCHNGCI